MLVEILTDTWINPDYIVSVIIDDMDRFPVLITLNAPDAAGEAQTYRTTLKAWEHIRIQLKLYSRLPKPSVVETQSSFEASADRHNRSAILSLPGGVTADEALKAVQSLTRGEVTIIESGLDRIELLIVDHDQDDQGNEPPMLFADVQDDDAGDPDEEEFVSTDLKRLVSLVRRGNFVILDTETTGLGATAEICSIAIIDDTGRVLLDTLVKPVRGIPADATRIHGMTNDTVKNARGWLNVNEQVWQLLHGRDVIVYNADYDFRLLVQSEKACEPFALSDWHTIKRTCAMNAYAEHVGDWNEYHGNYRWHKLTDAARAAGFNLPEGMKAHSAAADCMMTLAVCRYLAGADQQAAIDANEPI